MTEQYPDGFDPSSLAGRPNDVYAALRDMRRMFDAVDAAPAAEQAAPDVAETVDPPRAIDARSALEAIGVTYPADPNAPIALRAGDDRLRIPRDSAPHYEDVLLGAGEPDALAVVSDGLLGDRRGQDVIIPPTAASSTPPPERAPQRRSLRRRLFLGATAVVASAAALFGLSASEAPQAPAPAPGQSESLAEYPPVAPQGPEQKATVTSALTASSDTVTTVRQGDTISVSVRLGAENDRGPWAMTDEAYAAVGIDASDAQIAAANPWMRSSQGRVAARSLQNGATVIFSYADGALTPTATFQ